MVMAPLEGPTPTHPRVIHFTQYLRPFGRPTPVTIDRPDEIVDKAEALVAAGFKFEIEELRTGVVSMAVAGKSPETGEPDDIVATLVRNGPGVPEAVDRLVLRAYRKLIEKKEDA